MIMIVMMDGGLLLLVSVHVCLAWALVSVGDNLVPSIVSKLVEMCDCIATKKLTIDQSEWLLLWHFLIVMMVDCCL